MKYSFKKRIYKILIPAFDVLGSILFFPIRLFRKPPSNPKNILVVRLDHIGDFVCTTPLFKNIKKKFPAAKITVLINSASKDLAYRDPVIDKVITFSPAYLSRNEKSSSLKGLMRVVKDVKALGFDLGIDPRGDMLSMVIMWLGGVKYRIGYGITGGGFLLNMEGRYDRSVHVIDRNLALLKYLNIPVEDRSPSVYFNDKDMEAVEKLLREKVTGPNQREIGVFEQIPFSAIILHPFAGARTREWSRDSFQGLIDRLRGCGISIFLIGSGDDSIEYTGVIDMRGKFNIPQLAYFIKKVGCFIGLNSGPANIAAALGVSSVVISSGTNIVEDWIPPNKSARFIYRDVVCRPCENKICPKEKHECMNGITAEEVFGKFMEISKKGQDPFFMRRNEDIF